ncbi:hypothetical protein EI42_00381 [Thermosporothrix hazakensis]|jgi:hypothetical protein|uniref:Uncharacterized protein n=1 Tax=Thermosporothrix hazakensis TaxID=644383 RepID=A0A326UPW8_THEHA|nr:hypothetical protein [Thermosporothrix hazakensis]PZW36209.1 hypothetical protein EI42_00381 [Thermosporothrix hazakensis]
MKFLKRLKDLIPPWQMPSEPRKAIGWFLQWLFTLIVHFFWIPLAVYVVYQTYSVWITQNPFLGILSGIIAIFGGLVFWALLYGLLLVLNMVTGISRVISDVNRMQEQLYSQQTPFNSLFGNMRNPADMGRVVEGEVVEDEYTNNRRPPANGMIIRVVEEDPKQSHNK